MANTSLTVKVDQFKGILNSQTIRAQLKNSLKDNAGAFMSSMIDLYSGDTVLQSCDPEKVALECMKAAAIKLPISKALGFAYIVPYKKSGDFIPTFIIGYKGLIQLAQRTGLYKTINASPVYEGVYQGEDWLTGEIDLGGEKVSDKVIGFVAYFRLVNGFEKSLYMSQEEMQTWAKRYSKSYNSDYSPWKTEFEKMGCKTVLRRLIGTYGAMSIEMQDITPDDDDAENRSKRDIVSNANMVDVDMQSAPEQPQIAATAPLDDTQPEIKPEF